MALTNEQRQMIIDAAVRDAKAGTSKLRKDPGLMPPASEDLPEPQALEPASAHLTMAPQLSSDSSN